jgi:hypothetical protein
VQFPVFFKNAKPVYGDKIIKSISVMHDRSNGLGGALPVTAYIQNIRMVRLSYFL